MSIFKRAMKRFLMVMLAMGIVVTTIVTAPEEVGKGTGSVQAASNVSQRLEAICKRDVGSKYRGSFYGAIQCKGYAAKIMDELFQIGYIGSYDAKRYYIPSPAKGVYEVGRLNTSKMNNSTMTTLLNQCIPGDFIQVRRRRQGDHGHSMIVLGVDSATKKITILDCNADGKLTIQKYVQTYSTFLSKNSAMSVYRANSNKAEGMANSMSSVSVERPQITNVNISEITSNKLSFSFNVNSVTKLVRIVVINRTNNQETKQDYFPNQAKRYNVTLSFNSNTGNEYYVRIYAYAKENENYIQETLHALTYGSIAGVVQLPIQSQQALSDAEMESLCFDAKFYADHNLDVKAVYGYNKDLLYAHWVAYGLKEGRASSAIWNPKYYLEHNSDILAVAKNDYLFAYYHFQNWGWREMRASSDYYDGAYYLSKYMAEFNGFNSKDLLFHFKNYGLKEKRWASNSRYTGNSSWR